MAGLNVDLSIVSLQSDNNISINNVSEYNKLYIEKYTEHLHNLIMSGNYILGKNVLEFEQKIAAYLNIRYALGVSSGTSALELAFQALELTNNDEVIIQANAYIACAIGVLKSKANMVIIDCDNNGLFNIDILKQKITDKTKAVLVVHLYGDCCNMELLQTICKENKIILVEDCAQAFGTKYNNKMIGSFGDISCHSFYPSKNLGALGDGGAICTNNITYYNKLKLLRNLGSIKKYEHEIKGTNSRLDTLQAMFLSSKLLDVNNCIEHKNLISKLYINDLFFKHIRNPDELVLHSYHLYVILLDENIDRQHFIDYLLLNGIETIIHYKIPFYKTQAFIEYNNLIFEHTEKLANRILSLPIYNTITSSHIYYINKKIQQYNFSYVQKI
jgi:dTDP-4-amino-4,6-dideoxygalactose transaminase